MCVRAAVAQHARRHGCWLILLVLAIGNGEFGEELLRRTCFAGYTICRVHDFAGLLLLLCAPSSEVMLLGTTCCGGIDWCIHIYATGKGQMTRCQQCWICSVS